MTDWNLQFFLTSLLLGVGLSMDAFSVSLADGLFEPTMKANKIAGISSVFAFFQFLMPLVGWTIVHTIVERFQAIHKFIPFIAFGLLLFIGLKMIVEGIKSRKTKIKTVSLGLATLFAEGLATSMDALSVGFAIADFRLSKALVCSLIVAAATFGISWAGLIIGKKCGTKFSLAAAIFGGVILIFIGSDILITGFF